MMGNSKESHSMPYLIYGVIVHVDVSDQFINRKVCMSLLGLAWIVSLAAISLSRRRKSFVAISCAMGMILLRIFFNWMEWSNVVFDISRTIALDPLIILVGVMVIRSVLACDPYTSSSKHTFTSSLRSALLHVCSGVPNHHHDIDKDQTPKVTVLMTLASMFTMTGNIHSIFVFASTYDEIKWLEYLSNMIIPVGLGLGVTSLGLNYCCKLDENENDTNDEAVANVNDGNEAGYQGISPNEDSSITNSNDDEEELTEIESKEATEEREEKATQFFLTMRNSKTVSRRYVYDGIAAAMTFGYMMGCNISLVTVFGGLLFLGLYVAENAAFDKFVSKLDFEPICLYLGLSIITHAVADCGLIQDLYVNVLQQCVDQITSGPSCLYKFVLFQYVIALIGSPVVAVICFKVTYPYAAPYDWIQVSFALAAAHLARRTMELKKVDVASVKFFCITIISSLLFLFSGSFIISMLHFSPMCSMKLGECGD